MTDNSKEEGREGGRKKERKGSAFFQQVAFMGCLVVHVHLAIPSEN